MAARTFGFGKRVVQKRVIGVHNVPVAVSGKDSLGNVNSKYALDASSVVAACVKFAQNRIGELPRRIRTERGEIFISRPDWIEQPNANFTGLETMKHMVHSLLTDGEMFLHYVLDGSGGLLEYRVIDPSAVHVQVEDGMAVYSVNGVRSANILHSRYITAPGEVRGIPPLKALASAIKNAIGAEEVVRGQFARGATIDYIINTKGGLSEEDEESLLAELEARHHTAGASHQPMVISGDMKVEKVSISPHDLQLLETARYSEAKIAAQGFNMPPDALHITQPDSELIYRNESGVHRRIWADALKPLALVIEDALSQFLPPGLRFDIDARTYTDLVLTDASIVARNMSLVNKDLGRDVFSDEEIRETFGIIN